MISKKGNYKKQYKLQQQLKTETKGKYIYTTFVSQGIDTWYRLHLSNPVQH